MLRIAVKHPLVISEILRIDTEYEMVSGCAAMKADNIICRNIGLVCKTATLNAVGTRNAPTTLPVNPVGNGVEHPAMMLPCVLDMILTDILMYHLMYDCVLVILLTPVIHIRNAYHTLLQTTFIIILPMILTEIASDVRYLELRRLQSTLKVFIVETAETIRNETNRNNLIHTLYYLFILIVQRYKIIPK